MGAILKPAGDLTAGVQVKGAVKMYMVDGTSDASANTEGVSPYDSGNILGHVQPGGSGEKLVSGVIQRAQAALLCDSTSGNVGNALVSVATAVDPFIPTAPTGSTAAEGLSQAPQHE